MKRRSHANSQNIRNNKKLEAKPTHTVSPNSTQTNSNSQKELLLKLMTKLPLGIMNAQISTIILKKLRTMALMNSKTISNYIFKKNGFWTLMKKFYIRCKSEQCSSCQQQEYGLVLQNYHFQQPNQNLKTFKSWNKYLIVDIYFRVLLWHQARFSHFVNKYVSIPSAWNYPNIYSPALNADEIQSNTQLYFHIYKYKSSTWKNNFQTNSSLKVT